MIWPKSFAFLSPHQALGLATVLGGVLAACLVAFSDGALAAMGAGPETGSVHALATEFLTIRWGLPPGWLVVGKRLPALWWCADPSVGGAERWPPSSRPSGG